MGKQTLRHIHVLSFCPQALDRFTWRHDNVLNLIHDKIQNELHAGFHMNIDLVKSNDGQSLLIDSSCDTIPPDIACTSLRPDLTLINRQEKTMYICELTVPFEDNIAKAVERKFRKYESLVADIEGNGYKCNYTSIEIGARGIVGHGLGSLLKKITVLSKKQRKSMMKEISQMAIKCSYTIFKNRNDEQFNGTILI